MSTPTDGQVTDFDPLPLPVQGGDVFYVVRNGQDFHVEAQDLYTYYNSTTTTTTQAP